MVDSEIRSKPALGGDARASSLACSLASSRFARHRWRACPQANVNYPVEISVMSIEAGSVKNHKFFFAVINETSLLNFFVSLNSKCFVRPHFDQPFTHKLALHIFFMLHASRSHIRVSFHVSVA